MSEVKTQDIIRWALKDLRPLLRTSENSIEDFIDILHMFGALQEVGWTGEQFRKFMIEDEEIILLELKKSIFSILNINDEKIQLLKNKYENLERSKIKVLNYKKN